MLLELKPVMSFLTLFHKYKTKIYIGGHLWEGLTKRAKYIYLNRSVFFTCSNIFVITCFLHFICIFNIS